MVLNYLDRKQVLALQLLCRYFYDVQIPRCLPSCHIYTPKHRLHLINDAHIIIFDLLAF